MSPLVEHYLAVLLFLPWYVVLAVVFWRYPRLPNGAARRAFDALALLAALAGAAWGTDWAMRSAGAQTGGIWKQILASVTGYGLFLAVLLLAFALRRWLPVARRH